MNNVIKRYLNYFLFFVIIYFLCTGIFKILNIRLDFIPFFFIPAIILSVKYGTVVSIYTSILAFLSYFLFSYQIIRKTPDFYDISDILIYISLIFICGEISNIHIKSKWKAEGVLKEHQDKLEEITNNFVVLNRSYEDLTRKMLMINAQINTMITDFKRLKQLDKENILKEILLFLQMHNYVTQAGLYLKEKDIYKLKATLSKDDSFLPEFRKNHLEIVKMAEESGKIMCIKDMLNNNYEHLEDVDDIIAVPLIYKKDIILGVILIKKISFVYMNEFNLGLIQTLSSFFVDVIYEKFMLPEANSENFFSRELNIYSGKYFYERTENYLDYVKKYPGYVFSLAFLRIDTGITDEIIMSIKKILFSSDFMCVLDDEQKIIGICLNLMDGKTFDIFRKKLEIALDNLNIEKEKVKTRFFEYTNNTKDLSIPESGDIFK